MASASSLASAAFSRTSFWFCAARTDTWSACARTYKAKEHYARRMGQPTQRATNYTARSNIDTAQIFLHANGQRPKRAPIRQRSGRRQRRGEPHTEHGLGVLLAEGISEIWVRETFPACAGLGVSQIWGNGKVCLWLRVHPEFLQNPGLVQI